MVYYRTTSAACGKAPYGFGAWSQPALAISLIILWAALAILFNHVPEIDKSVTSLFFFASDCVTTIGAKICGDFPAAEVPLLKTLRRAFYALPIVAASVIVTIALRDLASGLRWSHERIRISTVALITLAVGPGLLVNAFMKEFIGRPRPANALLFGGEQPFVAAAQWSNACQHNCSFVSGEAAGIAWLICLLPLWPHEVRRRLALPIMVIIIVTDVLRVAFGRHYISDVILGSLSTVIVFCVLTCLCEIWTSRRFPLPDTRDQS
ncbi:phosphatase PAP2 family protein [Phyllobacterium sp. OV277]|jgi:membrane-associated phospholipid phosphatase|uniref:phosphatase PAP2 family protein n=1 Tax=Phyllobacterium sp. OV277 TaxID=1882772 RepID=UPI000889CBB9|nr:phosphatase PAP2 family protein [Phyllobacterium sp. OV277]SDO63019.1 PAP2 superfamily protein [Phyllobacterium sp. OV277]